MADPIHAWSATNHYWFASAHVTRKTGHSVLSSCGSSTNMMSLIELRQFFFDMAIADGTFHGVIDDVVVQGYLPLSLEQMLVFSKGLSIHPPFVSK